MHRNMDVFHSTFSSDERGSCASRIAKRISSKLGEPNSKVGLRKRLSANMDGSIPPEFPRSMHLAAVAGAHLKLAVRHVNGVYTDQWTEQELAARYEACLDMVTQLETYTQRKLEERPHWSIEDATKAVEVGLRKKGWGFTDLEIKWMISAVRAALV